MSAQPTRNLPAAVIEASDPVAVNSPRVVPADARMVKLRAAVLGYRKRRGGDTLATIRLREIERIIARRYGPAGCDTDDGAVYAILASHTLIPRLMQVQAGRTDTIELVVDRFTGWCARHLPMLPASEVRRIAERAIKEPRRFRADSAAKLIHLSMAERTALRVSTIGATDLDAEGRKAVSREAAKLRDRERKAQARRAGGARTQQEVEASSVAARCREQGISRATYYRRLKAGKIKAEAVRDTGVQQRDRENLVGGRDCLTSKAAKLQPPLRREPFRYYRTAAGHPGAKVGPCAARARPEGAWRSPQPLRASPLPSEGGWSRAGPVSPTHRWEAGRGRVAV
ncbi:hypothetical protein V5F31_06050 [Xanthobacter sp. V7C-4]|uniref:hypothetical protein n=1 Tax=Xanthobacter autotrophicus (strain ATCC BAA-1158 / Py2) TaxID=78245 RepID=UPI003728F284